MKTATPEQINEWKAKHGDIFKITIEGKSCFLKRPSRKVLGYASQVGAKDPIAFNEMILKDCWLKGDNELMTNDALFLGVSAKLAEIIEVKEADLEKL